MRKIFDEAPCQTWVLAYEVPFRGNDGAEHGYCSEGISLDDDDDPSGDEDFFRPSLASARSVWKLRQEWKLYRDRKARGGGDGEDDGMSRDGDGGREYPGYGEKDRNPRCGEGKRNGSHGFGEEVEKPRKMEKDRNPGGGQEEGNPRGQEREQEVESKPQKLRIGKQRVPRGSCIISDSGSGSSSDSADGFKEDAKRKLSEKIRHWDVSENAPIFDEYGSDSKQVGENNNNLPLSPPLPPLQKLAKPKIDQKTADGTPKRGRGRPRKEKPPPAEVPPPQPKNLARKYQIPESSDDDGSEPPPLLPKPRLNPNIVAAKHEHDDSSEEEETKLFDRDEQQQHWKALMTQTPLSKKKGSFIAISNNELEEEKTAAFSIEASKTLKKSSKTKQQLVQFSDPAQKKKRSDDPLEKHGSESKLINSTKPFSRTNLGKMPMEDDKKATLKQLKGGMYKLEQMPAAVLEDGLIKRRKLKSGGSINVNDESRKRVDERMLLKVKNDNSSKEKETTKAVKTFSSAAKDHQSSAQRGSSCIVQSPETVKDNCGSLGSGHSVIDEQAMAAAKDITIENENENGVIGGEEVSSGLMRGESGDKTEKKAVEVVHKTPNVGWVLCDDCQKWRCIPSELADAIEVTNRRWICMENPNEKFADCSIPQEKTNAQINAELNISEVSFCEDGDESNLPVESRHAEAQKKQDRRPSVWTLTKHNIFHHRQRKSLTIDEIMVCQCRPPEDEAVGCGEECLNRMLSIECVPGTCPCGHSCSNQQFQRRKYAKVTPVRCGKKGFGLQIAEDVPKGAFIIEYVGEVLDMQDYEARQKEYASRGHKHFYFMTLNATEVIDARVKGNLGRFVNHSCEPNCVTEKWMVNGEVCIGLFAIHDLKKGDEITCDYNFVRVCGAVAKKCYCGSPLCKGFIGGDPTTPLGVVESDSDEDDPEPIMLEEPEQEEGVDNKLATRREDKKMAIAAENDDRGNTRHSLKRKLAVAHSFSKQANTPKRFKANFMSRRLTTVKGLTIETTGGRFEGVEEKLNEILDNQGGICKRKDAARQYLKLLVVTAACGDTINEEASRSTRDLSMVLDALLKTISRSILVDIANKNGLQILHNMIKQNRKNYKRTPIIRKILKVLEFLATRQILTLEQINSKPLPIGVESFRDTIFKLSRHVDTEVQNISRRFREKWMNMTNNEKSTNVNNSSRNNEHGRFAPRLHPSTKEISHLSMKEFSHPSIKESRERSLSSLHQQHEKRKDPTERPYHEAPPAIVSEEEEKRRRRKSRWEKEVKPTFGDGYGHDYGHSHTVQVSDDVERRQTMAVNTMPAGNRLASNDFAAAVTHTKEVIESVGQSASKETLQRDDDVHVVAETVPDTQTLSTVCSESAVGLPPTSSPSQWHRQEDHHASQMIGPENSLPLPQIQQTDGLAFSCNEQMDENNIVLGIPQAQFVEAMLSVTVPGWPVQSIETSQSHPPPPPPPPPVLVGLEQRDAIMVSNIEPPVPGFSPSHSSLVTANNAEMQLDVGGQQDLNGFTTTWTSSAASPVLETSDGFCKPLSPPWIDVGAEMVSSAGGHRRASRFDVPFKLQSEAGDCSKRTNEARGSEPSAQRPRNNEVGGDSEASNRHSGWGQNAHTSVEKTSERSNKLYDRSSLGRSSSGKSHSERQNRGYDRYNSHSRPTGYSSTNRDERGRMPPPPHWSKSSERKSSGENPYALNDIHNSFDNSSSQRRSNLANDLNRNTTDGSRH